MTFSFIHTGDLHLDSPLAGLTAHGDPRAADIADAARRGFVDLVDLALTRKVDAFLIAGDLWDGSWRDVSAGLFVQRQAARLRDAGIAVIAVLGNHDAQSEVTDRIRAIDALTVLSSTAPQTVAVGPARIHGMSFATPAVTENLALRYPEAVPGAYNIGLLHTMLEKAEGHARYAPARLQDLTARGYDYFALGHVHARAILHHAPAHRGGTVAYCGVLQGRDVGETGPKGAYVVELSGGAAAVTPIDLRHVEWQVRSVALGPDGAFTRPVAAAFQEAARSPAAIVAVRVRLTGTTAAHDQLVARYDDVREAILHAAEGAGGGRLLVERVVLETSPPDDSAPRLPAQFEAFIEAAARDPGFGAAVADDLFAMIDMVPAGPARQRLRDRIDGFAAFEESRATGALTEGPVRRLAARLSARQS